MKKVLITGASGFWGSHLIPYLNSRGYRVYGACRHPGKNLPRGTKPVVMDIRNPKDVDAVIRRLKPDVICHLAGQSSVSKAWKLPEKTLQLNTLSTVFLLNAIRAFSPKTRFLLASSIHVFGGTFYKTRRPLREQDTTLPDNPYGASKRLAELVCLDFAQRYGLDCVMMRPVNCIGRHLSPHFVFSDWARQIADSEKTPGHSILTVGNLKLRRDFLHISDAVQACEILIRKGKRGEIYHLSSQRDVPLRVYAEFLVKSARVPVKIRVDKKRFRTSDPVTTRISSAKLRKLGWHPEKTALQGLKDLLDEWRKKLK